MVMRILGFEAWDAGSHRMVRQQLVRHGEAHWSWVTLGPGPWRWRQRMGMVELVQLARDRELLDQPWDCFVCTSLLAVGELRGLLPEALRDVPIAMLVHENQVAYPGGASGDEPRDLHAVVTDCTAMLAVDRVIFTSDWNRRSCMKGLHAMLSASPVHQCERLLERIEARSCVIWPPVEDPRTANRVVHNLDLGGRAGSGPAASGTSPLIVWPHRHQHDKGPRALRALAARYGTALNLRWLLLGERRGPTPAAMQRFRHEQRDAIVHDGFCQDRAEYLGWLAAADWVCSTAKHEFFGIATVEALLMGCLPWLPNRLSYPELLPEEAWGLHPGMAIDAATRQMLLDAMKKHLEPALAPRATTRLEAELRTIVATGPSGTSSSAQWAKSAL